MIKLTPKNLQGLGEAQKDVFISRLVQHMLQIWPEECQIVSHEKLPSVINGLVDQAQKYSLTTEYDVARYATVAFALRKINFDQSPWVAEVLNNYQLPPRVRMNRIWRRLMQEFAVNTVKENHHE
jgi:hypothetical protein